MSRRFAAFRQLRYPRRYVTDDCFRSLMVSLVHSRLHYGNFVLVGLIPAYLKRRLQSVFNAAACLVFRLRRYDHVTDRRSGKDLMMIMMMMNSALAAHASARTGRL